MTRSFKIALLAGSTLLISSGAMAQDFCANAFYPGDKDADGALSPQEVTDMRDAEFAALDLNEDGSIDRDEYANCLSQAGTQQMTQPTGEMADATDADGDGVISRSEYFLAAMSAYETSLNTGDSRSGGSETDFIWTSENDTSRLEQAEYSARVAETYNRADADRDGNVSRDEWMQRAEQYEVDISEVNQRFDAMDTDSSGDVSAEEYRDAGTQAAAQADEEARKDGMEGDFPVGHPPVVYYRFIIDGMG